MRGWNDMVDMRSMAFWALIAFVFAIPWERSVAIPFIGAAGTLFGAIALLLGIASTLDAGKIRLRPPPLLLIVMALFVLWSSIGYFWSIRPPAALSRTITYGQLLVMVWLVWQLTRDERQWRALLQAYVAGSFFAILVVIFNFARGEATLVSMNTGLTRFSFAGGDPNYFALSLVLAVPMAWLLVLQSRGRAVSAFNLAFIALAVIAIGLTGSRGGAISAIVALSIIPVTYWHLGFWRKIGLTLALAATAFGALYVIPDVTIQRFLETPDAVSEDNLAGRIGIWQAGLDVLRENEQAVVIGVGSGNFRYAVERALGDDRTAHNAYLNVWVDNGFIGILLFLSFFAIATLPHLSQKTLIRSFAVILVGSMLVGIFGLSWEREKALWFTVAILAVHRPLIVTPGLVSASSVTVHGRGTRQA